jgi:hypothetical protein
MSNKTIAKFVVLVIFVIASQMFISSCSHARSNGRYEVDPANFSVDYDKPVVVGQIDSEEITESSGLAASLCQTDVFWTHNDSGDDAFIFAINSKGKHLGTWRVSGARNDDWEDLGAFKDASGTCYIYIADVGDNKHDRQDHQIYRIKEPVVPSAGTPSSRKQPLQTEQATVTIFKYADSPHDAESMVVQPKTGDVYVLTKRLDGPSLVFKIVPAFGSNTVIKAEKVGEIALPAVPNGLLTGGSASPDGLRVVVCDYTAGYELNLGTAGNFDDIWKQKPIPVDLGDRKQGEAVAFSADGRSIFATSEKKNSPITEVKRK